MDCGEEISGGFVVARCDGAKLLELAEEIFDEMPRLVHLFVEGARDFAVALGGDHRRFACRKERLDLVLLGVKTFVCQQRIRFYFTVPPARAPLTRGRAFASQASGV